MFYINSLIFVSLIFVKWYFVLSSFSLYLWLVSLHASIFKILLLLLLVTIKLIIKCINFFACTSLSVTYYKNLILTFYYIKKETDWGLPWWRSGWASACQCRGHGFEPWSGKIPHAAEQLGPWATMTEPAHLEPVLRNKRRRDKWEARAPRWGVVPACRN